jgi:predicted DNA-binding ribbon-helix-helix protein
MDRQLASKVRQNVMIKGRRTSLTLEAGVWESLLEMCRSNESSLDELCERIVEKSDDGNMASSIRTAVIEYLMERCRLPPVTVWPA